MMTNASGREVHLGIVFHALKLGMKVRQFLVHKGVQALGEEFSISRLRPVAHQQLEPAASGLLLLLHLSTSKTMGDLLVQPARKISILYILFTPFSKSLRREKPGKKGLGKKRKGKKDYCL